MSFDPTNDVFRMAVDLVNQGRRNIFLTGKAGTGKTTFLRHIRENCPKQVAVVAPTGVAAINAGGVTIHSFFQLPLSPFIPVNHGGSQGEEGLDKTSLLGRQRLTSEKRKVMRELELLIIDEISMVRCDTLDAVDTVLRHVRRKPFEPFGGVQVLFIGDMYQLPPVIKEQEWRLISSYYPGPFFFDSQVIRNELPLFVEFKKIYRQSDQQFIDLLNQIRENALNATGRALLESRLQPQFQASESEGFILLTTHNEKARMINNRELSKLPDEPATYHARVKGEFFESAFPAEEVLQLKVGAQVMFIKNDSDRARRYFNGKIGKVTALENDRIMVSCGDEEEDIEVKTEEWLNIRYSINKQSQQLEEEEMGSFTQFPLRLAWAITIHKSQGLTFKNAIIDAGQSFAAGQVYVALSRCTSLDGLVLLSRIPEHALVTDRRIAEFSRLALSSNSLEEEVRAARASAERQLAISYFDFSAIITNFEELRSHLTEHAKEFNKEASAWAMNFSSKVSEVEETARKFHQWIQAQLVDDSQPSRNTNIKERSLKAAGYFIQKLDELLTELNNPPLETDSREQARIVNDRLSELYTSVALRKFLLGDFKADFDPVSWYARKKEFSKPYYRVNVYAGSRESVNNDVPHPALFSVLKQHRDRICEHKDLPVYLVASRATLQEMATFLPQTTSDLKKISGFGDAKVRQYGDEFIRIINEYCEENGVVSMMEEREAYLSAKKPPKKKKKSVEAGEEDAATPPADPPKKRAVAGESRAVSLELFKEGLSIKDIAERRSLAIGTIESHLSHFIGRGELDIAEVMDKDRLDKLLPALENARDRSLTEIVQSMENAFSFGEIRLGRAWIGFLDGKSNEPNEKEG